MIHPNAKHGAPNIRGSSRRTFLAASLSAAFGMAGAGGPRFSHPLGGVSAQALTVEEPPYEDRLIPDAENIAWDPLGDRTIKGIVYHRLEASLENTDELLRTLPAGGLQLCEPGFGGCFSLFDYGIDHESDRIMRWNDPFGDGHPGVSEDRSGRANGAVIEPSGDALAFLEANGNNLDIVNRDQVSIAISGGFQDPLSGDCILSIGWLSAYLADSMFPDWQQYPVLPEGYSFVRMHKEFNGSSQCPGPEMQAQMPTIIVQTQAVMQFFRDGGTT